MRWLTLVGFSLYVSYLVTVGVGLLLLPWSHGWSRLVFSSPHRLAVYLDQPFVQGLVATVGLLHLVLVVAESVAVLIDANGSRDSQRQSRP